MPGKTLEAAVAKVEQKIDSHLDSCERRYQEWNGRVEKLFDFIKEAHKENRVDINEIKDTLAEQRGASKLGKVIAHATTGIISAASALGIGIAIHK